MCVILIVYNIILEPILQNHKMCVYTTVKLDTCDHVGTLLLLAPACVVYSSLSYTKYVHHSKFQIVYYTVPNACSKLTAYG